MIWAVRTRSPCDAVRSLLPGAFLSAVVTGPDEAVTAVARLGRRMTGRPGCWQWLSGTGSSLTGPVTPTALEIIVQVNARRLHGAAADASAFLVAVADTARPVNELTSRQRGLGPHQLTALNWAQPLCSVAGCNHTASMQADHRIEWVRCLETGLPNIDRLCVHHHRLKTHHGYRLASGTGRRALIPP